MKMKYLLWLAVCLSFFTECLAVTILPSRQTVTTGQKISVTLPCNLETTCPDSPQITWYKGRPGIGQRVLSVNTAGKVLVNSNYTGRVHVEGQAGLVIISPDLGDDGNYSCEALITVDIPPIATGFVYLNVSRKIKLTAPLVGDDVSLVLGVLVTIAFLLGLVQLIVCERQLLLESPLGIFPVYMDLLWIGLCLVSATTLWIRYSLREDISYRVCIGTAGMVTCVIGLTLCSIRQLHRALVWYRGRTRNTHRSGEEEMRSLQEPMLKPTPYMNGKTTVSQSPGKATVSQSPGKVAPMIAAWSLDEKTCSRC